MSPTGDLLVTFIFLWGESLELAQSLSCVALALHIAGRSTPFGVTISPVFVCSTIAASTVKAWFLCKRTLTK